MQPDRIRAEFLAAVHAGHYDPPLKTGSDQQ